MSRILNTICFVTFFVSLGAYVIGAELLAIVSMCISGIAAIIEYTIQ